MDLAAFRQLLTSAGQAALQAAMALAPREADFLAHYTSLSRRYPPELARAALETAILRLEAGGGVAPKFPHAAHMYFTRPALEQASGSEIAAYRARRYARLPGLAQVLDLGCSIGSDSLALAQHAPVTGLDLDPLRLALASANTLALQPPHPARFVQADLLSPLPFAAPSDTTALFFDPARRTEGRRIFSVRDYHPPLSRVLAWMEAWPAVGVKISPGVNLDELAAYPAEVEFISVRGELKEAMLWFGPLRRAGEVGPQPAAFRATLLPGGHSLARPAVEPEPERALSAPQAYLYEPDPAILRAGLVTHLAAQLGAAQLDEDIAYLTTGVYHATPFARAWQVEDWFPFQLKHLRTWLRQRSVGRVVVKKRGSPLQPEALIRDLRLQGDQERVLFLTHLQGKPVVVVCFANG